MKTAILTVGTEILFGQIVNTNAAFLSQQLNHLGYDCGTPDGIAGAKFTSAVKKYQFDKNCVQDGEITAKGTTWKKLLGLK